MCLDGRGNYIAPAHGGLRKVARAPVGEALQPGHVDVGDGILRDRQVRAEGTDHVGACFVQQAWAKGVRPVHVGEVRAVCRVIVERGARSRTHRGVVGAHELGVEAVLGADVVVAADAPLVAIARHRVADVRDPQHRQVGRQVRRGCVVAAGDLAGGHKATGGKHQRGRREQYLRGHVVRQVGLRPLVKSLRLDRVGLGRYGRGAQHVNGTVEEEPVLEDRSARGDAHLLTGKRRCGVLKVSAGGQVVVQEVVVAGAVEFVRARLGEHVDGRPAIATL